MGKLSTRAKPALCPQFGFRHHVLLCPCTGPQDPARAQGRECRQLSPVAGPSLCFRWGEAPAGHRKHAWVLRPHAAICPHAAMWPCCTCVLPGPGLSQQPGAGQGCPYKPLGFSQCTERGHAPAGAGCQADIHCICKKTLNKISHWVSPSLPSWASPLLHRSVNVVFNAYI